MAAAEPDDPTEPRRGAGIPIEITAITAILALTLATLAGAGAALYQRSKTSRYVSSSVLLIDQPIAVAGDPDDGALLKLQELRYYYAGVLNTQVIADPVSRQVHLPTAQIEGSVVATIAPTSFTMRISAVGASPSQSNQIAQAATGELISYVNKQQAHLGVPGANRVVLDEVSTPSAGVKTPVSTRKIVLAGVVAFIVVGAAFLIVADLLRRRW